MNNSLGDGPLGGELVDLERALATSKAALPAGLEQRVLSAVGRELAAGPHGRNGWAGFAAAAAAMVLVTLNFTMAATRPDDLAPPGPDPQQVQAVYEDIRAALPELSPAEARRQSLLLAAASAWSAYPPPPPRGPLNGPARTSQLDQLLENDHGIHPVLD
jgi:hypothetical protein